MNGTARRKLQPEELDVSRFAHRICERCLRRSKLIYQDDVRLTDAHKGSYCCWCDEVIEFSLVLHRHPDAVPCKGRHGVTFW